MTDADHYSGYDDETLEVVEQSLPRVAPPADMFDRILAEIAPEAKVVPLRPRSRRRRVIALAGALAAAAVIVLAVIVIGRDTTPKPDARAAIAGKSDPAVSGQATLYGSNAAGGTVRLSLRDVPPAPSGHHYEVWVLRRNGDGVMEAVGSFSPSTSSVRLDLPLPGPGDYGAVDISVEEDGGSPAHSDTSLAGGTFT